MRWPRPKEKKAIQAINNNLSDNLSEVPSARQDPVFSLVLNPLEKCRRSDEFIVENPSVPLLPDLPCDENHSRFETLRMVGGGVCDRMPVV